MRKFLVFLAVLGAAGWAAARAAGQWRQTWGVDPEEAGRPLPGDELVPDAAAIETRGITIEAPPDAVWPWLVQMGYGRAGWYSYDVLDMNQPSATKILPEHQRLAEREIVPSFPGGGFLVKTLEPGHALVLYSDTASMQAQVAASKAAAGDGEVEEPANLRATGAAMSVAQPADFRASWAFVVDPLPGGRSRLIERFRIRFGGPEQPWMRFTMPMMGFGVFVMIRRQMLGIRQRVERSAHAPDAPPASAEEGEQPALAEGSPAA